MSVSRVRGTDIEHMAWLSTHCLLYPVLEEVYLGKVPVQDISLTRETQRTDDRDAAIRGMVWPCRKRIN